MAGLYFFIDLLGKFFFACVLDNYTYFVISCWLFSNVGRGLRLTPVFVVRRPPEYSKTGSFQKR